MNKLIWVSSALIVGLGAGFFLSVGMQSEPAAEAAEVTVRHEYIDPVPSLRFTQVVSTTANGVKTIHVSGQIGTGETHEAQTESACANLIARLEKAGATESDVVMLNVYIKDLDADAVQGVKAGKDKVFTAEQQPASTWVGVTALVAPRALVEIEAVAIIAE